MYHFKCHTLGMSIGVFGDIYIGFTADEVMGGGMIDILRLFKIVFLFYYILIKKISYFS